MRISDAVMSKPEGLPGRHTIKLEELPPAEEAAPRRVLVRITRCGLCGSDLHKLFNQEGFLRVRDR